MAPTVDDLRVKQCFICLEEERYDDPNATRRRWIHPCTCTLVAHEDCVKTWMFSSDSADEQQSRNTHACPQCKIPYQLAVSNPKMFNFTSKLQSGVNRLGKYTAVATVACTSASMLGLAYVPAAYYGARAFKAIAGPAIYDTVLTNDPSRWPASAWLDLPLIPISLIMSEFNVSTPYLTLLTMSAEIAGASILSGWDTSSFATNDILSSEPTRLWPPSTYAFTLIIFPLVRIGYNKLRAKVLSRLVVHVLTKYMAIGTTIGAAHLSDQAMHELEERQQNERLGARRGAGVEIQVEVGPRPIQGNQDNLPIRVPLVRILNYGTRILNALSMPFIASYMGSQLLKLSNHSTVLHSFLAPAPGILAKGPAHGGIGKVFSLLSDLLGNTRSLELHDPVWWRNAVGLGVFIVARDIVGFVRMYLFYRRSFHVRFENQDFRLADVPALDLAPHFPHNIPWTG